MLCSADYDPASIPTSRVFQPADTQLCFDVTIINDLIALEPDETLTLDFSYFDGSSTSTDSSIVTIVDDDGESSLTTFLAD